MITDDGLSQLVSNVVWFVGMNLSRLYIPLIKAGEKLCNMSAAGG